MVDLESITVSLTPIGAHQDVIVKRIDEDKYTFNQGEVCQSIVSIISLVKERIVKRTFPNTKELPKDYPGDNTQYLQSGKA